VPDLWPHQLEALDVCAREHRQRKRSQVLVQCPPGTGKTEIAVRLAIRWCVERPFGRCLVGVSSAPILKQFYARLVQSTRLPIGVDMAQACASRQAKIVVGTQQSLWNRLDKYGRDTLLIFDECHHGNLDAPENQRLVETFDHVVGLSATPWSRGCRKLFANSARVSLPLFLAIQDGLLAPYTLAEWEPPRGPWGLVFCGTNQECEQLSRAHPGSSWVGVQVPAAQLEDRIKRWRSGSLGVLYANRMLLEGFDEPRCSNVWIAKESDSDILLAQMAGRALRRRPGKTAQIYCAAPAIAEALSAALARCNEPSLRLV
jgi:superfamily II DNA or RNA helicase